MNITGVSGRYPPQGEYVRTTPPSKEQAHSPKEPRTDTNNTNAGQAVRSLFAYENTYTEKDALFNQCFGKVQLWEEDSNGKRQLAVSASSQLGMDEMLAQLQVSGGNKEVDFSKLSVDFMGMPFSEDGSDLDKLELKADYLASRYSWMKARINETYSGDGRESALAELESRYQTTLNDLAVSFSKSVGGFLEQSGVPGSEQQVFDNLVKGVKERAEQYSKLINDNPNFAGASKAEDQWLKTDDAYMAARLREALGSEEGKTAVANADSQAEEYSLKDLSLAGKLVGELKQQLYRVNPENAYIHVRDEESIGLDLAVLGMKTAVFIKDSGMGAKMSQALQQTYHSFVGEYIGNLQKQLETCPKQLASDKEGFAPLEENDVWNVYHFVMNEYHSSGDIQKSLASGAEYAKNRYDAKASKDGYTGIYRYQNSYYWDNFYSVEPQQKLHGNGTISGGYQQNKSTLQGYTESWNQFVKSMSLGNTHLISFGHSLSKYA